MASIAEKIKQKLQALEQYTYEELDDKKSLISESEEDSHCDIEESTFDCKKRKSVDIQIHKQEFLQNFSIDKNISNTNDLKSRRNSNNLNNLKIVNHNQNNNDINYVINEYVANKTKSKISPERSHKGRNPYYCPHKSQLNYHTNYSTDLTKNYDSDKPNTFNYIELGEFKEENIYYETEYLRTSDPSYYSDEEQFENKFPNQTEDSPQLIDSQTNNDINAKSKNNLIIHSNPDSNNSNKETNFAINNENIIEMEFNYKEESFYYNKFDDNNTDALKTTTQSKVSDNPIQNNNFSFLFDITEEVLYILLVILLLAFDPVIILCLKISDFICLKLNIFKSNDNSKIENISHPKVGHLLHCGEIEEIDFNDINVYDLNKRNLSSYEKYFEYFFNRCEFRKHRKIIKILFIGISLFMNVYILANVQERSSKLLLFFLNNLYLLYHTMDIYNEKLVGFTENLKWSRIIEKI